MVDEMRQIFIIIIYHLSFLLILVGEAQIAVDTVIIRQDEIMDEEMVDDDMVDSRDDGG